MTPEVGSRAWFEAYLTAFNAAEFEVFGAFYHPDVEFAGRAAELRGCDAVLAFYREVRQRIDERIELLSFIGSDSMCAAEILTTLVPLVDWPDFPTGPLMRGEPRRSINFAFYDLADGVFIRIRSAGFRQFA